MPSRHSCAIATVAGLAALLSAPEARAQSEAPATIFFGNAYLGASPGGTIAPSLHTTFSGGVAGGGDITFKPGRALSGYIGYRFNDAAAGEAEIGFASFKEDKFNGTLNGTPVSASIDGQINSVMAFANLIVTPFGRTAFAPYVGFGAGAARLDQKINSINGAPVNTSSHDTHFAANMMVGFDLAVARWLSVGGRYRFLWVNNSTNPGNGIIAKLDDFGAHIVTATAALHF